MIVEFLFAVVVTLATGLFAILPDWEPFDISGYIADNAGLHFGGDGYIRQAYAFLNGYVPMDQVLLVLGAAVTLFVAMLAYQGLVWLLTKLHILGGD